MKKLVIWLMIFSSKFLYADEEIYEVSKLNPDLADEDERKEGMYFRKE